MLCLPELCITGYGCEDAFHVAGTCSARRWRVLAGAPARRRRAWSSRSACRCCISNALFNTACLVVDGRIARLRRPSRTWPATASTTSRAGSSPGRPAHGPRSTSTAQSYPLGDLLFDCGGVRIGFEICEDAWVADRPGGELALRGVDLILNPSASHFAFGKLDVRKRFVLEGSRAFGVSYVYANLLGNEAGRAIYDGDALIASAASCSPPGRGSRSPIVQLTTAVVDIDATRMSQARTGSFRPRPRAETPTTASRAPFRFPAADAASRRRSTLPAWETGPHVKEEEFTRAVALALFDYLRKSRSHGFVVSLSGGADSAAVSLPGRRCWSQFGVARAGPRGVAGEAAATSRGSQAADDAERIVRRLLDLRLPGDRATAAT